MRGTPHWRRFLALAALAASTLLRPVAGWAKDPFLMYEEAQSKQYGYPLPRVPSDDEVMAVIGDYYQDDEIRPNEGTRIWWSVSGLKITSEPNNAGPDPYRGPTVVATWKDVCHTRYASNGYEPPPDERYWFIIIGHRQDGGSPEWGIQACSWFKEESLQLQSVEAVIQPGAAPVEEGPQRVTITVRSTSVQDGRLTVQFSYESKSPIVSQDFRRVEGGALTQGHVSLASGSGTAECSIAAGEANVFELSLRNEDEKGAETAIRVDASGKVAGATTTGEEGETNVATEAPGADDSKHAGSGKKGSSKVLTAAAVAAVAIPAIVAVILRVVLGGGAKVPPVAPPVPPPAPPARPPAPPPMPPQPPPEKPPESQGKPEDDEVASKARIEILRQRMQKIIEQRTREGYYIANPDLARKAWNNTAGYYVRDWFTGGKWGQCQEGEQWGREWLSQSEVESIFGPGAEYTNLTIQNTYLPGNINHIANRVLLPDGRRVMVDFWKGLSTGDASKAIVPESEWIEEWNRSCSFQTPPGDNMATINYELVGSNIKQPFRPTDVTVVRTGLEQALQQQIAAWGPEEGIRQYLRGAQIAAAKHGGPNVARLKSMERVVRSYRREPF